LLQIQFGGVNRAGCRHVISSDRTTVVVQKTKLPSNFRGKNMSKLLAAIFAAMFALGTVSVFAADAKKEEPKKEAKKEEAKKDDKKK